MFEWKYLPVTVEKIIKSFRIRKSGYKSYHDGFVFISYSRIQEFGLEFDNISNQLIIDILIKDEGGFRLTNNLTPEDHKIFLRRWNHFLKNDEYFFDLADFSRNELI